jgi:hypothetical protein
VAEGVAPQQGGNSLGRGESGDVESVIIKKVKMEKTGERRKRRQKRN